MSENKGLLGAIANGTAEIDPKITDTQYLEKLGAEARKTGVAASPLDRVVDVNKPVVDKTISPIASPLSHTGS